MEGVPMSIYSFLVALHRAWEHGTAAQFLDANEGKALRDALAEAEQSRGTTEPGCQNPANAPEAPAGPSGGATATYRIEDGRICRGCANCEPLGECNDADGCDGTGFVPTQTAPMAPVTPDERAELHDLIVSFHAVTDPEERPDLCARAFAVTKQCDNVGHCVPHKQPPSSLAAPEDAGTALSREHPFVVSAMEDAFFAGVTRANDERPIHENFAAWRSRTIPR